MKNVFYFFLAAFFFVSCSSKDKKQTKKKVENNEYTISKDGIGGLKIGLTQPEVEKLLNQKFDFNEMKDSAGYWSDTVKTKYKDIEVSLYFERQYIDEDHGIMQISGMETSSPLCKTTSGVGIGDEKLDILAEYEENPIDMSPDWEVVNDTTWVMSKTKYSINVKDDKWDRALIFHLVNKKVVSLQAGIIMGE
jgi:hypothetical protein